MNNINFNNNQDADNLNIAPENKNGNKKLIVFIVITVLIIVGIGGYFVFKKPIVPTPPVNVDIGKCGDNVCDDFEKRDSKICPQDCVGTKTEDEEKYKCPQYIPPAPSFYENCKNKGGSIEAGKKNDQGCQLPPQCVLREDQIGVTKGNKAINEGSPFGFHPGNAENYSYIKDLDAKWSREGYYLIWSWVDSNRDGNYNFTQTQGPAAPNLSISGPQINYDAQWLKAPDNIKIVANTCPFLINSLNGETGFKNSKEMENYQDFAGKAAERYDGDDDYGCVLLSPDCYKKDDNQHPSAETIKYFQKNPIKYWQVCNQLTEVSQNRNDIASTFALIQEKTYKAVKKASSAAEILIAGDSEKEMYPDVFKKLGGKYIDIIDFHRYGNNYNPKEDFDYLKSSLRSAGFETNKLKFWMTETGTYSGMPQSGLDKDQPYQSEKEQAEVLVKIYVSALSYKIEKIFWAWNIVEGFSRDGIIFDYTGLVYDGCDYVNNKYQCGSNVGYDKGAGVKKLGYYTYKKMVEILDGSDWNNTQTVQEKDGIYVYKFVKNGKSIWVAWNDNAGEKQITISGINSSSVKITEAVPNYSSGKEVKDYSAAFKMEIKKTPDNKVGINISDVPVFVEEI